MKKLDFFLQKKYLFFTIFLIIYFIFFANNFYLYVYDGHHHGLMYSNAIDLINGLIPYKEIFIQYGILTTIIHALVLVFFGENIHFINFATIFFYYTAIFFIYLIINHITNHFYAFCGAFALISNHPVPWLPWSNYLSFFFIVIGIYFFIKEHKFSSFFFGFFLGLAVLSRQDYFLPITFSLIIYILLLFFIQKVDYIKKNTKIITGYILPILFFFTYLFLNNLFFIWIKYLNLPSIYLESRNLDIFILTINYIYFFLTESFFSFINEPQYVLISIILIVNFFCLFFFYKKFNTKLLFISILSLSLSIIGISTELFRLYTSVSLGIITTIYFISSFNSNDLRKFSLFFIFSTSIFSILSYSYGNNPAFKQITKLDNYKAVNIDIFKYQRWPHYKVEPLVKINNIKNKIISSCSIEYFENLTFDIYYTNILNLKRIRLFPYLHSSEKNGLLENYFNTNFIETINNEINNENIIILVVENNDKFKDGVLVYGSKYSFEEINLNNLNDKPYILKFYYPTKCYTKS